MKFATQVGPQLIPAGVLLTVPLPEPVVTTVRAFCGTGENVAVTALADVPTVMEHVDVPVHAPVQPANNDPAAGVAVSTMVDAVLTFAEQVPGQLMPPTLLVTVPLPVPAMVTATGNEVGMKSALTACADVMVTLHAPVPLHAPPQPLKVKPACGVAVRVTVEVLGKSNAQVVPQEIPAGELVMVPDPVTDVFSVKFSAGAGAKFATRVNTAGGMAERTAETTAFWLANVTWHVPVPVHAPLQPVNI